MYVMYVGVCKYMVMLNVSSTTVQGERYVKANNGWDLCHGWDSRRTQTSGCLTLLGARRRACIPSIVLQETIPGPSYRRSATNGALGKGKFTILAKFRLL